MHAVVTCFYTTHPALDKPSQLDLCLWRKLFLTLLAQSAATPVECFGPTVALEDVQTSFSAPLANEGSPTLEQQEHSRRALKGHLRHTADLKHIVATVKHPADRLQDLISVRSNEIIELEAAIRQSTDFSKVALPIIRPTIEKLLSEYRDELQLVKLRDNTLSVPFYLLGRQ